MHISILSAPYHIVKIMQPVLDELNTLENGNGFIDKEEFVEAMFRLYQILNSKEKEELLNFDKKPMADPYAKDCTFKPNFSKTQKKRNKLASYLNPVANNSMKTINYSVDSNSIKKSRYDTAP